jgi:hypothetical protein
LKKGRLEQSHMTTIVPAQPDVVYIPYLRDSLKSGAFYFPEMEPGRTRGGELVADILAGEHSFLTA